MQCKRNISSSAQKWHPIPLAAKCSILCSLAKTSNIFSISELLFMFSFFLFNSFEMILYGKFKLNIFSTPFSLQVLQHFLLHWVSVVRFVPILNGAHMYIMPNMYERRLAFRFYLKLIENYLAKRGEQGEHTYWTCINIEITIFLCHSKPYFWRKCQQQRPTSKFTISIDKCVLFVCYQRWNLVANIQTVFFSLRFVEEKPRK